MRPAISLGFGGIKAFRHISLKIFNSIKNILVIKKYFSPVALHLLLAAEALAADVALVEAGHVASLVNHQVVRLVNMSIIIISLKIFYDYY